MLKNFTIQFKDLSKDYELRNDEKFHSFLYFNNWNLFNSKKDLIRLRDILIPDYKLFDFKENKEYRGIPTGQDYLDEDGDIINFQIISKDNHPSRLRYKIDKNNILISSLRLAKSPAKIFENIDFDEYVFSNGFYIFKVNKNWDKKLILYILKTKKLKNILDSYIYRGIGISSYKQSDLLNIKIPLISKEKQERVIKKIIFSENRIKKLKNEIENPQDIINGVFANQFNFNFSFLSEFGKGMTAGTQNLPNRKLRVFQKNFSEFSGSDILRFSTRFHNEPTKNLMNFLDKMETIKIKDIIDSYEKGIQPKYDKNGEIPVIKIANLKNGYIDFSETEKISKQNFNKIENDKKLRLNDIIICATGKISLGKIDFYEYKKEAITSLDNYILRIKNSYNPLFLIYFFRSIIGYFQIERDFTGTTNQIHLYWDQIANFQIPNISLSYQQRIVDKIKSQIDKQERIKREITNERKKIDEIIENVMRFENSK